MPVRETPLSGVKKHLSIQTSSRWTWRKWHSRVTQCERKDSSSLWWWTSATALHSYLCEPGSPAKIWVGLLLFCFDYFLFNQICVLIRLEKDEDSAAGRLMLWLHSVVPAPAPPPKTTATDHWYSRSAFRAWAFRTEPSDYRRFSLAQVWGRGGRIKLQKHRIKSNRQ